MLLAFESFAFERCVFECVFQILSVLAEFRSSRSLLRGEPKAVLREPGGHYSAHAGVGDELAHVFVGVHNNSQIHLLNRRHKFQTRTVLSSLF